MRSASISQILEPSLQGLISIVHIIVNFHVLKIVNKLVYTSIQLHNDCSPILFSILQEMVKSFLEKSLKSNFQNTPINVANSFATYD